MTTTTTRTQGRAFEWINLLTKVGLPTLLVLYLLGAIPGFHSPIDRIEGAMAEHTRTSREQTDALLRVLQALCRYQVPREAQHECYGPPY